MIKPPTMTPSIDELRGLLANGTPTPWEYRPYEYDDWGFIRGPEIELSMGPCKPVVAIAREGGAMPDDDEHRRNKTDPYGPNALLIVAAVNTLPTLLSRLTSLEAENAASARNVYRMQEASAAIVKRNEALEAENAALREAVTKIANYEGGTDYTMRCGMRGIAKDALAALTLRSKDDG